MFQHKWCAIFLSSLQATGKAGKDASDRNIPREQIIKDIYINRLLLVILQQYCVKDTLSHNISLFFIHCVVKLDVLCLA